MPGVLDKVLATGSLATGLERPRDFFDTPSTIQHGVDHDEADNEGAFIQDM